MPMRQKSAGEKSLKIDIVAKSGDNRRGRVWESCKGVGDPEEAIFLNNRHLCEKKEPGIMSFVGKGATSPWFTCLGSDLLIVKVDLTTG